MKKYLLYILVLAVAIGQAQPSGLTIVKANAPYNEIKVVQGEMYAFFTYFYGDSIYKINPSTGEGPLVGVVPFSVRIGNIFQSNYFGNIGGKLWSMSRNGADLKLWKIDATSIDSIAYFPSSDAILNARQVKQKAVIFLSQGIWSTDLNTAPIRLDDAVANYPTNRVLSFDTIAYYTKIGNGKQYLFSTDGSSVRVLDSCSDVNNNISLSGYNNGEFHYCLSPSQYGAVIIKKISAAGVVSTVNTVGTDYYDNGAAHNNAINDNYMLFRLYRQSPYVQNLYAYNFASSQLVQLTNFTTAASPSISITRDGAGSTNAYVYVDAQGTTDDGTWVTDGTAAGTRLYDAKELEFYMQDNFYDLPNTAIVCGDYPVAGIATGSFPNQEEEYYFGKSDGLHMVNLSAAGKSKPGWFTKFEGSIYFTAYPNYQGDNEERTDLYRVDACELAVGINETQKEFSLRVYPNPANNSVQVELSDATATDKITLREMNGRIVEVPTVKTAWGYTLNTSEISSGIYIISIETEGNVFSRRLVISR